MSQEIASRCSWEYSKGVLRNIPKNLRFGNGPHTILIIFLINVLHTVKKNSIFKITVLTASVFQSKGKTIMEFSTHLTSGAFSAVSVDVHSRQAPSTRPVRSLAGLSGFIIKGGISQAKKSGRRLFAAGYIRKSPCQVQARPVCCAVIPFPSTGV